MFDRAARKQVRGDYDRTWLSDDYFDLIVWSSPDDTIHGFQLCYGKPIWERALTWRSGNGFSHMQVDDGELAAWGKPDSHLITRWHLSGGVGHGRVPPPRRRAAA